MCHELEEMKKQLTDKENVIKDYQKRIEELSSTVEVDSNFDIDLTVFTQLSKNTDRKENIYFTSISKYNFLYCQLYYEHFLQSPKLFG
jgi:hypothetical protein